MYRYRDLHIGQFEAQRAAQLGSYIQRHPFVAQVLINRGIATRSAYLDMSLVSTARLYNAFLLPDMEKAVEILSRAIREQQLLLICGDYDSDGICGTSILHNGLRALGAQTEFDLPLRRRDGYGMSRRQVDRAVELGASVLLSIDCGSSDAQIVDYAHERGLTVIVSDHHLVPEQLPQADAFVNPKRPDSQYPEPMLCGAAVAWKILAALCRTLEQPEPVSYLDYVALASIADMVPITGENRLLCALGLREMSKWEHQGLRALGKEAKLLNQPLSSTDIGFFLAPRLNSPGRLDDPNRCVDLFSSSDAETCQAIAAQIEELNATRLKMQSEIIDYIEEHLDIRQARERGFILEVGPWHPGVVGLAASRLMNTYRLPCLVGHTSSDGQSIGGSGRAPEGTNLHAILSDCAQQLQRFGGHAAAAGFGLNAADLPAFRERLCQVMPKHLQIVPPKEVDFEIKLSDIDVEWVEQLRDLEPTGRKFPKPLFLVKGVRFSDVRELKDGQYFAAQVDQATSPHSKLKSVMFKSAVDVKRYRLLEQTCDIVCSLEVDHYREPVPRILIEDFVAATGEQTQALVKRECLDCGLGYELERAAAPDIRFVNDKRSHSSGLSAVLALLNKKHVLATSRAVCAYPQRLVHFQALKDRVSLIDWKGLLATGERAGVSDIVFLDPPLNLEALRRAPFMAQVKRLHLVYTENSWAEIAEYIERWSLTATQMEQAWRVLQELLQTGPIDISTPRALHQLSQRHPSLQTINAVLAVAQSAQLLRNSQGQLSLIQARPAPKEFWQEQPTLRRLCELKDNFASTRRQLQAPSLSPDLFWL